MQCAEYQSQTLPRLRQPYLAQSNTRMADIMAPICSVALTEAALAAAAAHGGAWTELAACAVTSCTAACTRSLNQRKVFEAGTHRLMAAMLPHFHRPGGIEGLQHYICCEPCHLHAFMHCF